MSAVELAQVEVDETTYDLRDDGALREDQGTGNAGKTMIVGTDGKLVPVEAVERQTVTLSASGWTAGSDYAYIQTATVSGMTAETEFDWDVALTGTDAEGDAATREAFAVIQYANGQSGSVVFKATEQPGVNLPVIVRTFT